MNSETFREDDEAGPEIDFDDGFEVDYWSKQLKITQQKLRKTAEEAGSSSVEVIRKYLRNKYYYSGKVK